MLLRWFSSRTVRKATELHRHVRRLLNEQRDLLSKDAVQAVETSCRNLSQAISSSRDKDKIREEMERLIAAAEASFQPHPNPNLRENIKELVVAATAILAFTTFFLQLTKIPTGSLQPTLYGITETDLRGDSEVPIPGWFGRMAHFWFRGISYVHVQARADGELKQIEPPRRLLPFIQVQSFLVGEEWYRVWFPPDQMVERAGLSIGQFFKKGDDIMKMKVVSGDHLLVDRFTFNFRRPERGEIIVFKTKGIKGLPQDQLYIKRLVALGGEKVQIGDDQHLIINDERLDASVRGFENVYTFKSVPQENQYFGHVNDKIARRYGRSLSRMFPDETVPFQVRSGYYLAMGDNTLNSRDSRDWGELPQENVIGKCWFVYWPITERFGWGYR